MEKMKRTSPRNKAFGFTLVELVIVIAVIAILAAVLIPTFIGVIDSANNSADIQLAANLNSTVAAEVQLNSNVAASAQNIRFKAKDYGYEAENIATKKSDNVIVYNKNNGRFEVLDVSDIKPEQLVPAYYAEEVIDGYIIVSTKGNDLAEALYDLSNLPSETAAASIANISAIQPAMANSGIMPIDYTETASTSDLIKNHVQKALDRIDNADILGAVTTIVKSTLFVTADNKMYYIDIDGDTVSNAFEITKDEIMQYETITNIIKDGQRVRSRVVFSEEFGESEENVFDLDNLMVPKSGLKVIIPDNVKVENTYENTHPGEYEDMPTFYGNVGDFNGNVGSVSTAKELIENNDEEAIILYDINQVYTSDFGGSFVEALEMADKLHKLQEEFKEENQIKNDFSTIRLVVNGESTISSGTVTIPEYVEVEIPFAIGNNNSATIMSFTTGDVLGGKPLGFAYPANDAENLKKPEAERQYYLCGEGPGGGPDVWFQFGGSGVDTTDPEIQEIFAPSKNIAGKEKQSKFLLTVANGAKLAVNGKLTVGAVIGYNNAGGYQGHTSGAYAQINNNGTIAVEDGGVLDVWGFVKGSGEVVANEKAMVFEPFVVTDYADTVATLWLYPFVGTDGAGPEQNIKFNSPFMRYTVMNIQTKITLHYGAALFGRANLIVFGSLLYCRTDAPLVTSDGYIYDSSAKKVKTTQELIDEGYVASADGTTYTKGADDNAQVLFAHGAFSLQNGASLVGIYDGTKTVGITQNNSENYEWEDVANRYSLAGDIGVNNITFYGNVKTYGIKMDLLGGAKNIEKNTLQQIMQALNPIPVDTSWCVFPVPYFFNFTVAKDSDLTITKGNRYALLPGSALTVDGTLTIEDNAALYALDTMDNSAFFRSLDQIFDMMSDLNIQHTEDGIFVLMNQSLGPINMMLSVARKYYPSALLLENNKFKPYAEMMVNGTVAVMEGGNIGGTVIAGNDAKIDIKANAGIGGVISLGGPYEITAQFYDIIFSDFGDSVPFQLLTTVYVPCDLHVINSQGKEVALTIENYTTTQEQMTFTLEIPFTSSTDIVEATSEDKKVTVKLPYRTATKDIVITKEMITEASEKYSRGTKVAYYALDLVSQSFALKDNSTQVE